MRVVFRVDGSSQIGLGHVMRCLALAKALIDVDAKVSFIVRHIMDSSLARLEAAGCTVVKLGANGDDVDASADVGAQDYAKWLGVPWQQDAAETVAALEQLGGADWLVVDHYALDEKWQREVRGVVRHIAVIDDLDNRPHECDLLIDHNPSIATTPRYALNTPNDCLRLLGPRYALLRPEFASARGDAPPIRHQLKHVLISLGGADPHGLTAHVLAALVPLAFEGFCLDVVLGGASQQRASIERAVSAIPNASVHVDVRDLTPLYLTADVAVGAAGTSAWERCALGLPTILLTLAENQMVGAQALSERGGGIHLGPATAQHLVALTGLLRALAQSPNWLSVMSRRAAEICDGMGAARVAARMESFDMQLRRASDEDREALWHWRNDEINRRFALDPNPIEWDAHVRWFDARLQDADCILLIAEDDVGPIGVLRYDINAASASVSVYLVPGRHGQGRGGVLLLAGERWLTANRSDVSEIEAEIVVDNHASLNVFAESGYVEHSRVFVKYLGDEA